MHIKPKLVLTLLLSVGICGCASLGTLKRLNNHSSYFCERIYADIELDNRVKTLDTISRLFHSRCYSEVISAGSKVRKLYDDKFYSVTGEVASLLFPEGSVTPYVLESYERTYLTYLISASYLHKQSLDGPEIELRQANEQLLAHLYNYGEDPVNMTLMAAAWNNLSPDMSRSFWQRITELEDSAPDLRKFASNEVSRIDNSGPTPNFKVYALGSFPRVNWKMDINKTKSKSFYHYSPAPDFSTSCESDTGVLVSTKPWFNKISRRYHNDYHPLLNLKSWTRLPIALTYGLGTIIGGVALGAAGCYVDFAANGNGDICGYAIEAGGKVASFSDDIVDYTLKPDLRHWRNLPEAFLITRADSESKEICYHQAKWRLRNKVKSIIK